MQLSVLVLIFCSYHKRNSANRITWHDLLLQRRKKKKEKESKKRKRAQKKARKKAREAAELILGIGSQVILSQT